MSRARAQHTGGAALREHVADGETPQYMQKMMDSLDPTASAMLRKWRERVRAGGGFVTRWYTLPDGAIPLGGHNPCDFVIVGGDDVIRWERR